MAKTAVLLIIFNRPDTTSKVFDAIRKYKPTKLFIAADGPRENKPGEKEKCEEARKITEKIDWPCKAKRLYREKNLGCKYAVSSAITWFFENVEEGIILEDDCLPNTSFFEFCEKMIEKYKEDNRIISVTGSNFLKGRVRLQDSYFFSRYVYSWGWATWKRAWKLYDVEMLDWRQYRKNSFLKNYLGDFSLVLYWRYIFNTAKNVDTWDFQWTFTAFKYKMLTIVPSVNMVSNIGHDTNATHTVKESNVMELAVDSLQFPLKYPKIVQRNEKADLVTEWTIYLNPRIFSGLVGRYLLEKLGLIKRKYIV